MPLSAPTVARTPQHIRRIHFNSFVREDGLWDIEGELLDTKAVDVPRVNSPGIRKAGDPIHHMWIRVTVNTQLVVQSIEAVMDAHPLGGCPAALEAMQKMVGSCMARGWRKSIETHLGTIAGCTHMRELLQSMATATFQSIVGAFTTTPDTPPRYLGQCKGWDFDGPGVAEHFPQFVHFQAKPKA
ncbi:DUF2889 domain-containing protein [Comamonas terrigena]|jgi:hypothetical protein|uniref:DUF2889 domain-containing protein n=1 Tax=Comamonas terrigena TaxID=32013 RepID=UPI002353BA29|nr:DUF2889 domain-containing protein [Comamonas terrigena]MDH0048940.1 DUF2889 domain-containing protein [Comamonas terrigena]MDH0511865.1 DUF2889 domain-containing protein [Comamonas terrigena]MDH1091196.1 DUF2889 domain-containing protein [Comamonas terrigena]MDH1501915.1 DUF2889 domain-containing protein [Comamonas terrigena]